VPVIGTLAPMKVNLSKRTIFLIDNIFDDELSECAQNLLSQECTKAILSCDSWDESQLERIWFAAIKISGGDLDKLMDAIVLSQVDWRDLLISAGFADNLDSHNKWSYQYGS